MALTTPPHALGMHSATTADMRRLSCLLLAALMGVACAAKQSVLPRTLWERKIRTDKRRLQTPSQATSSTEELRAMLNINEGTIAAFDAISTDLIKTLSENKILAQIEFEAKQFQKQAELGQKTGLGIFDKMFSTFKILQQSPSYQDAITQGQDLKDPATQSKVLMGAVSDFATLAFNLRVTVDKDKAAPGGINGRVLEFLSSGDEATVALAERVQAGDASAIKEMQQSFMDAKYPGINLEALMDDDFVKASRAKLLNDEGLKALMNNEENTLDLLLDDDLLFANNPIYKKEEL